MDTGFQSREPKRVISMRKNSVIIKIFILMACLAIFLSIGLSLFIKARAERDIEEHMQEEVSILVDSLNYAITPLILEDDSNHIIEMIESFIKYDIFTKISVLDRHGLILYSTDPEEVGNVISSDLLTELLRHPENGQERDGIKDSAFMMALPVIDSVKGVNQNARFERILSIQIDYGETEEIGAMIVNDLSVALVVIVVIFLGILYLFMDQTLGYPLTKLMDATKELSEHNYSHRIDIKAQNELHDLAVTFNQMAENIQANSIELAEAKNVAERSSEARLEFLAKMSHEIRTPLNAIIGFSDILSEDIQTPENKENLEIIQNSSKHLLNLINEILDIAKIENKHMELESQPLSLRSIVRDISKMFLLTLKEKSVDLSYEVDVNVPSVYAGDAHRIRQVLLNLVSNAAKFTLEGSIEILISYEAPYTIIEVNDTGIGIPEERQAEIFEAYTQSEKSTAHEYGGTGLGLSISKRIAHMMGGDIELKSHVGEGSNFKVTLLLDPVLVREISGSQMVERWLNSDSTLEDITLEVLISLPERMRNIVVAAEMQNYEKLEYYIHSLKGVTGNFHIAEIYEISQRFDEYLIDENIERGVVEDYIYKLQGIIRRIPKDLVLNEPSRVDVERETGLKVLVAEDIKENRLLIKQILKNTSVEIDFAGNGVEAIEKLEQNVYDCLLLDIQMPILSGVDVLKWIRKSKQMEGLYVIALTANAFKEDMEKYLSLGAHWFLSKPVNKTVLRQKINDLIQIKNESSMD